MNNVRIISGTAMMIRILFYCYIFTGFIFETLNGYAGNGYNGSSSGIQQLSYDTYQSIPGSYSVGEATDPAVRSHLLSMDIKNRFEEWMLYFPQEKLYIHTDKYNYLPGETIWFSTYLLDASTHFRSVLSRMAVIELVDSSGEVTDRRFIEIKDGKGKGDIIIETEREAGTYILRGYTRYMQNYTDAPLFEKQINIWNVPFLNEEKNVIYPGPTEAEISSPESFEDALFNVQFFPQGGEIVGGLLSVVAVKVTDHQGSGQDARGTVYDETGKTVEEFTTTRFGMGKFDFIPDAGHSYYAEVVSNGVMKRFNLPPVRDEGYTLQILHHSDYFPGEALINIQANTSEGLEGAVLVGHMRGQLFCLEQLPEGNTALVRIDKSDFPAGIVHFTLFSGNGFPVAERLLFIEEQTPSAMLDIDISSDMFDNREKVEVEINLRDDKGNPLSGVFSIAVTDSYIVPSTHQIRNIETHMLLSSDLPGVIEDPGYFFDPSNDDRYELLDLLMMTNGWRRFNWDELMAGKYPEMNFPAGKGYFILGQATDVDNRDQPVKARIMLVASGEGFHFETLVTGDDGYFYFDGFDFHDTTLIILQGEVYRERRETRRERRGIGEEVMSIRDRWMTFHIIEPALAFNEFSVAEAREEDLETIKSYLEDSMKDAALFPFRDLWQLEIEEIEIRARKPVEKSPFDRALHGRPLRHSNRVVVDSLPFVTNDILNLIVTTFPGLSIRTNSMGEVTLMRRGIMGYVGVTVLLDGFETNIDHIRHIPPEFISFIDFIEDNRVYGNLRDPDSQSALAIYTKDRSDMKFRPAQGITSFILPGYHQAREFYSPVYDNSHEEKKEDDFRTTLYWDPEVNISPEGKAKIKFYTSDKSSLFRIVMEGFTSAGIPLTAGEKFFVGDIQENN